MTDRFATPVFTAQDANGATVPGAQLFFFTTGTNTAKDTFSDAALTTANPNPVVADFTGRFGDIFLESGDYKVVLKDADDAVIWTRDPVTGTSTSIGSLTDADGDTKIQVEESADEDKIRFDALGVEIAVIDSNGLNFKIGGGITDADGDTKIQLEEGADDDTIRFDALGAEIATIESGGVDILNSKTLGVGAAHDLGVGVHVKSGDSGASSVDAGADELIVEGSGDSGMTILSGASSIGNIFFADSGGTKRGRIEYDHSGETMLIASANGERMRFTQAGPIIFNNGGATTTTNTKQTNGLTIQQGGANDEILAFKSSDIAHGVTDVTETDTYGYIKKSQATLGGVTIGSQVDSGSISFIVSAMQGSGDTSKGTGSVGPIRLQAAQNSGTGVGQVDANSNILVVNATATSASQRTIFIVDEDGDFHYDGVDAGAFDAHDDSALIISFNEFLGANSGKPDFERMETLADLRLIGEVSGEEWDEGIRPLVNGAQMQRLLVGNSVQSYVREQVRDTILAQLIPGYRQAMEALAMGRNVGSLPELIAA